MAALLAEEAEESAQRAARAEKKGRKVRARAEEERARACEEAAEADRRAEEEAAAAREVRGENLLSWASGGRSSNQSRRATRCAAHALLEHASCRPGPCSRLAPEVMLSAETARASDEHGRCLVRHQVKAVKWCMSEGQVVDNASGSLREADCHRHDAG